MIESDKQKAYYKYSSDVLSGNIVACRYVKLACKRFEDFLKREDLEFREDKVDKVLNLFQDGIVSSTV